MDGADSAPASAASASYHAEAVGATLAGSVTHRQSRGDPQRGGGELVGPTGSALGVSAPAGDGKLPDGASAARAVASESTQQHHAEAASPLAGKGSLRRPGTSSGRADSALERSESASSSSCPFPAGPPPACGTFPRRPSRGSSDRRDGLLNSKCGSAPFSAGARFFLVPLPSRLGCLLSPASRSRAEVGGLAAPGLKVDAHSVSPPALDARESKCGFSPSSASDAASTCRMEADAQEPQATRQVAAGAVSPMRSADASENAQGHLETRCVSVGFDWASKYPWGLETLLTEHAFDQARRRKEARRLGGSASPCLKAGDDAKAGDPVQTGTQTQSRTGPMAGRHDATSNGDIPCTKQDDVQSTSRVKTEEDESKGGISRGHNRASPEGEGTVVRRGEERVDFFVLPPLPCCSCCLCKGTGCRGSLRSSSRVLREAPSQLSSCQHCFCWAQSGCRSARVASQTSDPTHTHGSAFADPHEATSLKENRERQEKRGHGKRDARETKELKLGVSRENKYEAPRGRTLHLRPLLRHDGACASLLSALISHVKSSHRGSKLTESASTLAPSEEASSWLPPCRAFGDHWEAAVNPEFCQLTPCCAAGPIRMHQTGGMDSCRVPVLASDSLERPAKLDLSDRTPSKKASAAEGEKQSFSCTSSSSSPPSSSGCASSSCDASASSRRAPHSSRRETPQSAGDVSLASVHLSACVSVPCCVRRVRFFLPEHLALQDLLPSLRPSSAALGAASPLSPHPECLEKTRKAALSSAPADGGAGASREGDGVKVNNQVVLPYVVGDGRSFAGMGFVPALCTCRDRNLFKPWLLKRHAEMTRKKRGRGGNALAHKDAAQQDSASGSTENVASEGGAGEDEPKAADRRQGTAAEVKPVAALIREDENGEKAASDPEEKETVPSRRARDTQAHTDASSEAVAEANALSGLHAAPEQKDEAKAVRFSVCPPTLAERPDSPSSSSPSAAPSRSPFPSVCPSPSCQGLLFVPYSLIEVPLVRGVESLSSLAETVAFPSNTELFSGLLRHTAVVVCASEAHERQCWRALKGAKLHLSSVVFDVDAGDFVPFHSRRDAAFDPKKERRGKSDSVLPFREQVQLDQHLTELQHVGEAASSSAASLFAETAETGTKENGGAAEATGAEARERDAETKENGVSGALSTEDLVALVFDPVDTEGRQRIASFAAERRPMEIALRSVGCLGKNPCQAERAQTHKRGGGGNRRAAELRGGVREGGERDSGRTGGGDEKTTGVGLEGREPSGGTAPDVQDADAEQERLLLLQTLASHLLAEAEGRFTGEEDEHENVGTQGRLADKECWCAVPGHRDEAAVSAQSSSADNEECALSGNKRGEKEKRYASHTEEFLPPPSSVDFFSSSGRSAARALERAGQRPDLFSEGALLSLAAQLFSAETPEKERDLSTRKRKRRREALSSRSRRRHSVTDSDVEESRLGSGESGETDRKGRRRDAGDVVAQAGRGRGAEEESGRQGTLSLPVSPRSADEGDAPASGEGRARKRSSFLSRASSAESVSSPSSFDSMPCSTLSSPALGRPSLASLAGRAGEWAGTTRVECHRGGRVVRESSHACRLREAYCRRRGLVWGEEQERELAKLESLFKHDPRSARSRPAATSGLPAPATENGVRRDKAGEEREAQRHKPRDPLPVVVPARIGGQVPPPLPNPATVSSAAGAEETGSRRAGTPGSAAPPAPPVRQRAVGGHCAQAAPPPSSSPPPLPRAHPDPLGSHSSSYQPNIASSSSFSSVSLSVPSSAFGSSASASSMSSSSSVSVSHGGGEPVVLLPRNPFPLVPSADCQRSLASVSSSSAQHEEKRVAVAASAGVWERAEEFAGCRGYAAVPPPTIRPLYGAHAEDAQTAAHGMEACVSLADSAGRAFSLSGIARETRDRGRDDEMRRSASDFVSRPLSAGPKIILLPNSYQKAEQWYSSDAAQPGGDERTASSPKAALNLRAAGRRGEETRAANYDEEEEAKKKLVGHQLQQARLMRHNANPNLRNF
ncbi:hypothetical protein BESB_043650 [Besnoitia besnoiti]|uniref:Uncharacterized protein n=1 Tax=Besnoitia besnoiti TaxID=94643 RepID=A0A2A9MKG7_BESBE|nr:hypothetical protein BESB_043650 [Besnoitia besnoiti]PFH36173.1 hypothetical protein BESB_043650 [Besnoitia besnoiti]